MNFHHTHVSESAVERATNCLKQSRLSEGEIVKAFEDRLQERLGVVNPVTVNSGTSALHLALILAGVGPGNEVILPAQTFLATGMAVFMCGARPVFADIDPLTGNLHPASVTHYASGRTAAVLPVHWAGLPCELGELANIARLYDATVVEDAAHALGAVYQGEPIGSISAFTCFSFQAVKSLSTADGGAVCCKWPPDAARAKRLRWFDLDRKEGWDELGERRSLAKELGYKYHMNDLEAAIGLGNLDTFPKRLARRRAIDLRYRQELILPGLTQLRRDAGVVSACWVFSTLVERRVDFVRKLKEKGIPTSIVNARIDNHPVFGGRRKDLPGQEIWDEKHIALPCHEELTDEDVSLIVNTIKEGW